MAGPGPKLTVAPPPLAPPRVGLIASASEIVENDEHWMNGYSYAPENCSDASVGDPCHGVTPPVNANAAIVNVDPFWIRAFDKCSAFGFEARDYKGRAQRLLAACESKQMEKEFWAGAQTKASGWDNRYLASPMSDVLSPNTGMTPIDALACLEQGLAQCGCGTRGMIHATRQIVTIWASAFLLQRSGNLITTINDTIVVPGAGYDGSDPDGNPAVNGAVWAYATGMVNFRRGPIETVPETYAQAVNKSNNDVQFFAQRMAAVDWNGCCHLAAQIDVDVCGIAGS